MDIDRNVFSITTDGASVMTKLSEEYIKVPFHLLCQAHGLHLAVTDLLYSKRKKSDDITEIFSQQSLADDQVHCFLFPNVVTSCSFNAILLYVCSNFYFNVCLDVVHIATLKSCSFLFTTSYIKVSMQSGQSESCDEDEDDDEESDGEASVAEVDDNELDDMDEEAARAYVLAKDIKLVTKIRGIVRKIKKSELRRNSLLERAEAELGETFCFLPGLAIK